MNTLKRNPYLVTAVRCAGPGCGTTQKEDSLWFVTKIEQRAFICLPYAVGRPLLSSEQPVCGHLCASRLFDRYLSSAGTITATETKSADVGARIQANSAKSQTNAAVVQKSITHSTVRH